MSSPFSPRLRSSSAKKTLLALTIPPATQASFHPVTSVFASPQKTVFSYSSNTCTKSLKEFLGTPECFRDKQTTTFFQLTSDNYDEHHSFLAVIAQKVIEQSGIHGVIMNNQILHCTRFQKENSLSPKGI